MYAIAALLGRIDSHDKKTIQLNQCPMRPALSGKPIYLLFCGIICTYLHKLSPLWETKFMIYKMKNGAECRSRTDDLPLTLPHRLLPPIVRGLDYPLAIADALGPLRLVSTPSQIGLGSGLAWSFDFSFPRI